MDFYSDDDLKDVLAELELEDTEEADAAEDEEMLASQRRYEEILKKHKAD